MKTARDVDLQTLARVYFKSQRRLLSTSTWSKRGSSCWMQVVRISKDMLGRLHGPDRRRARLEAGLPAALSRATRPISCAAGAGPPGAGHRAARRRAAASSSPDGFSIRASWSRMVLLKSTRHFYARLDPTWVRLPRPDVSDGFADHPLFAEWLATMGDISTASSPSCRGRSRSPPTRCITSKSSSRTRAAPSCRSSSATATSQRCCGKSWARSTSTTRPSTVSSATIWVRSSRRSVGGAGLGIVGDRRPRCFGAPDRAQPRVSMVVPLSDGWSDFDINLARFAADPDLRAARADRRGAAGRRRSGRAGAAPVCAVLSTSGSRWC